IAGPVGSLLSKTLERGMEAAALVVESDANFPDPDAARAIIDEGIEPLTGIEVDTSELHESAENIKQQKQELIDRLQQMQDDHSTEAYPREMYK
ncbi:MAG: PAC2 family protein, partial [Candidatus Nanohaloarchaea archaeon]|nr:PAC2 family protein [Candidatus Nanohaloarchaea archaeon]